MTSAALKGYRGMGMEGSVARWYDQTTRKDMEPFRSTARRLEGLLASGEILEVAPGPGFLSIELARSGRYKVTALDVSKTFVALARKNAAESGVQPEFLEGNASAMPFGDNRFDLVVCRAAFKNFSQPQKALEEIYRVLRPGGTGLIIDLSRDTPMREIKKYVDGMGTGLLNRWMTLSTFRFVLLRRAYTRGQVEQMLTPIPFLRKEVRQESLGFEIWLTK
ncbi:MAG TPA: methyltransferase domain-containing protein [Acidobacteriaceae bacterium]|jgi:ubiquinone/menaquinone biosynthesis C-methylase UbiE|nr:methyltransferase domain-containing protein [Acidobacteriaceae bacterium]